MKYILSFLILFIGLVGQAQEKVPFTLLNSGHILIKSSFEGVEGDFIFDTGAGVNLLFDRFAKKLPPQKTHNFIVGHRATGEELKIHLYKSKNLNIGGLTFKDQLYSTFDLDVAGLDGLISLQPFMESTVTIDYEKKELIIGELKEDQKRKFIDIELSDLGGRALDIFTYVKLNDSVTIQVMLDAGAGSNSFWIHSDFIDVLNIDKAKLSVTERKSEFIPEKFNKFYTGTLQQFADVKGLTKTLNPKVQFVEGLIYEGKTGIDWLGKKLAISIKEKKIYILD